MTDAYVARQPILDKHKKIFAYELLFRDSMANFAPVIDGDAATGQVLNHYLINIGIDEICGDKKSFINFTENLLLSKTPPLPASDKIVIEILENVRPSREVIEACREMKRQGFLLALDDFVYSAELKPLIEQAAIIKFDFRVSTPEEIKSSLEKLPRPGPRLLAEKIETNEEFKLARKLGFEFFQGYFFCRPEIIRGREISTSQLNALAIVASLSREDFDFAEIEEMVARDVAISYKLLRYINSPFFAKPHRISTIRQALVYLGGDELRRFMSLITLSSLAAGKPEELLGLACIRGKFCELLGLNAQKKTRTNELFTVGMFSLLDAIMDQPMRAILNKIPLSRDLNRALTEKKGPLAAFLILNLAYEQGRWPLVAELAGRLGIEENKIPQLYREACRWSNSVSPG
ncbi:MAG: HDOD domain-containing protein [Deltaproteobacteria bacterium]|nr:HDOD domain-containing protein [Deltaproteobacteria bacterium]